MFESIASLSDEAVTKALPACIALYPSFQAAGLEKAKERLVREPTGHHGDASLLAMDEDSYGSKSSGRL